MDNRFVRTALPALACLFFLLAGCSSVNVWPFGGGSGQAGARVPSDAIEYQCAGGKRFYLRYLDNGGAAWIILPDREFRLNKVASAAGTRYSNGSANLDLNGQEATLAEVSSFAFAGCKTAVK